MSYHDEQVDELTGRLGSAVKVAGRQAGKTKTARLCPSRFLLLDMTDRRQTGPTAKLFEGLRAEDQGSCCSGLSGWWRLTCDFDFMTFSRFRWLCSSDFWNANKQLRFDAKSGR